MPGGIRKQHVGVDEFPSARERGELQLPRLLAFALADLGRDRCTAGRSEAQQQLFTVAHVRPTPLCKVEHLLHVAHVGHGVARSGGRHPTSVTPQRKGAAPPEREEKDAPRRLVASASRTGRGFCVLDVAPTTIHHRIVTMWRSRERTGGVDRGAGHLRPPATSTPSPLGIASVARKALHARLVA